MYAKRETFKGQSGLLERLILSPEQQETADRLIRALEHALQIARPEIPGLNTAIPMAEGYLSPAEIHVVWIFDRHEQLANALEQGGARLLYQLTAVALREARMQVDGIDVNVHFDCEEDRKRDSHGSWDARLSLLYYPARQLESTLSSGKSPMTLVRKPAF